MLCQNELLIAGTELQQEDLFLELSALIALDQTTKLDQETPVSFCNKTLEWNASSNSISLSLPTSFYMELLQRHNLEDEQPTTSLEQEELSQDASGQHRALDASRQELYQKTVGDLVWATACRPDLCFEVHLLTQSLTAPTTEQEMQLHKVLRYLKGTLHYTLSLHPTNKRQEEKAKSLELLAFSTTSWTGACRSTSAAYMTLWGAPLVASCTTSCAYNQVDAELDGVRLALGLACHTKSFLQQLGVDQLENLVDIRLKTSSLRVELVTGRPLAMQLGLSRRNKHIELQSDKGQLHLSKVHPEKNLAHSLTNHASDKRMLAKLRVLTEAAEMGALSTVLSQDLASLGSSSSLVGVVIAEPPAMANHQLRQFDLPKSDYESCSRTCFERPSLTLPSLSLQSNNFESLTLTSWSLSADNLDSLILPSCSLQSENADSLTLQSLSFTSDSLEETEKNKEHSLAKGGAETNSFSQHSLQEELCQLELVDENADREAGTNSFTPKSFLERILSLKRRLRIFLLVSFQLTCAALFLGTSYVTKSFQSLSEQLCKSNFPSMISQLALRTSLSLHQFGSTTCRSQLQQNKFQAEQLGQQQLPANRALATQLQHNQHQNNEPDDNKLDENKNFDSNQLQRNKFDTKKQNKQLQEQPVPDSELRQLHLYQLHDQDQPFKGTKQLSKKPCFTSCLSRQMISSFSKQELERLHLTRSSFRQDDHQEQLEHRQSAQLFAEHLSDNSLHRNRPQQQQLVQQSFYPKMKKKQLQDLRSQLRKAQPGTAYSRLSLQQLPLSNLLLKSFQLTSAALLSAALVAFSLVIYKHKSFQLPLQQLYLGWAQGGASSHRASPGTRCTALRVPALTLISLSYAIAWLTPFSLAWRRRRRRA